MTKLQRYYFESQVIREAADMGIFVNWTPKKEEDNKGEISEIPPSS